MVAGNEERSAAWYCDEDLRPGIKKPSDESKRLRCFRFFEKRQGDVFDYHEHIDVYTAKMYFIAQILGAGLAAYAVQYLVVVPPIVASPDYHVPAMIIGEFLFTFALCYTVLLTATSKKTEGNSYYGLAIGSTVTAGIYSTGTFCLAAFNPAVAIGLLTMGAITSKLAGVTLLIDFVGGIAAGFLYKFINYDN